MFDERSAQESIFDIENYVLMGEITEDTPMGRWSVGHYPDGRGWNVVSTQATKEKIVRRTYKEKALRIYEEISNEYKEVARRVMEHRVPGVFLSNIDKRETYYKYWREYTDEIKQREKAKKEQEARIRAEKSGEAYKRRTESYADYVLYYCDKTGQAFDSRTDYLWFSEDGYVVFEGNFAHNYDAYLICGNIKNIKDYYSEIKALIRKYIESKEGHVMYDRERKNPEIIGATRKIAGYIRREVNIDTLQYEDIVDMYNEAIKEHVFPDEYGKREIMKQISDYNDYMNKNRGGF
ncbi:MAG: hypothetical protein K5679_01060 [Lachnospiraceae bacterium]|nr:hypothetical protein [Lachnospiraceae bacterium]